MAKKSPSVYDRVLAALQNGRSVTADLIGTNDKTIVEAWQTWDGKGIPPMVDEVDQWQSDQDQVNAFERFLRS